MKTKRFIFLMLLILILAGCQGATPPVNDSAEQEPIITLAELLPAEAGYQWYCFGFAEYGHNMSLDEIVLDAEADRVTYHISGEVEDVSGEGDPEDYKFAFDYVIVDGQLKQIGGGKWMMESSYLEMSLLRTPFNVGETWMQTVYMKVNGEPIELACTLMGINWVDDALALTMEYRQGENYEVRIFKEGRGVSSYLRTLPIGDNGELIEVGYSTFFWE